MSDARRITTPMTVPEFRRWADRQPGKWELVHGQPRAMAPPSTTHGLIQLRAGVLIERHLEAIGSPCRALTEAAIVPASFRRSNARSADLAITCASPDRDGWEVDDPVFILEVLSPYNEADTRDNVWAYMTIPSVRQILLLQSTAVRGELFQRTEAGTWPEEAVELAGTDTVQITAIGLAGTLDQFYTRTRLLPP